VERVRLVFHATNTDAEEEALVTCICTLAKEMLEAEEGGIGQDYRWGKGPKNQKTKTTKFKTTNCMLLKIRRRTALKSYLDSYLLLIGSSLHIALSYPQGVAPPSKELIPQGALYISQ